jgi:hypothetical protein
MVNSRCHHNGSLYHHYALTILDVAHTSAG